MTRVVFHPDAEKELKALNAVEQVAMLHAVEKLAALGPLLPFPHQSHIQSGGKLRELRPRAGRSRWRGLYAQVGDTFVIASISPEAKIDPRTFRRAVAAASRRIDEIQP